MQHYTSEKAEPSSSSTNPDWASGRVLRGPGACADKRRFCNTASPGSNFRPSPDCRSGSSTSVSFRERFARNRSSSFWRRFGPRSRSQN